MKTNSKIKVSVILQTHSKREINMVNRYPYPDDPMKGEVVFDPPMYTASSEWEMVEVGCFFQAKIAFLPFYTFLHSSYSLVDYQRAQV